MSPPPDTPRIWVLNHYPVLPVRVGGQAAVLGLAEQLALGAPTTLVWTSRKPTPLPPHRVPTADGRAGPELPLRPLPNRWLQRKAMKLLARWTGGPEGDLATMAFCAGNRALMRLLRQEVRDGDTIVLCHPWLWPAVAEATRGRPVRRVFDAHNVEHRLKRQALPDNALTRRAVQRVAALEGEAVAQSDLVLACTADDAAALAALGRIDPARVFVGSKGVALSAEAARGAQARALRPAIGRTAVFVGSNHPPNNEAARWVLQVLAPACPQWRFRIVGTCAFHCGQPPANATLVGPVEDLHAELATADVALNPITAGSGINMKLFEYLQHGLPVLSTAFGARGLEPLPAPGLLQTEREGFADALARLQAEPALAARLSAEGPPFVAGRFGWDAIGRRLRAALNIPDPS